MLKKNKNVFPSLYRSNETDSYKIEINQPAKAIGFSGINETNPTFASYKEMLDNVYKLNTVAYAYLMPILIAVGIFTNVVNMFVLHDLGKIKDRRHKGGSPTTYMYLNWLSFAQLLTCASVIPSIANLYRTSLNYVWSMYFAHFEIFLINSLSSSSVYIVVGLSVDRFVAVCKPHSYRVLSQIRLAVVRILSCFVAPPLFYAPLCFFQKVVSSKDGDGYTIINNEAVTGMTFWQFWNVAVELCHRLIPAIVIVVLNVCIILQFKKVKNSSCRSSRKSLGSEESFGDDKSQLSVKSSFGKLTFQDQDFRVFVLLMGVIIVFLVSTLPSAYLGLTDTFGHKYKSFKFEVSKMSLL